MDSTALESSINLFLHENKIVTLTNSYNEMARLKSGDPISAEPQFNAAPVQRNLYTKALAISKIKIFKVLYLGFEELVKSDATNDLADSQYWLAECYYSQKDFKRAIAEFESIYLCWNG